jgi:hypothetical protein
MTDQQKSEDLNYKIEIPNSIFDMKLSPSQFTLYSHIKRIAGDAGECIVSSSCLAKNSNMSIDTVKRQKKVLVERKLIKTIIRKNPDKFFQTTIIQILDC